MSASVELYPFQIEAVDALSYIFSADEIAMSALLTMAPRSGKTEVVIENYRSFREEEERPRGLYLCDSSLIPKQAQRRFEERLGETFTTTNDPQDEDKEFTFTTFQRLRNDIAEGAIDPNRYDYVIVDECHHAPADTYSNVVKFLTPKRLIGLSGTPHRLDGRDVTEIFGESTYQFGIGEMIAKGFTKNIDYRVRLDQNLREYLLQADDNDGALLNESARAIQPNLKAIVKDLHAETANLNDPKVIIYAQNIDHAEMIERYFPGSCDTVHSGKTSKENQDIISRFNEAELSAIIAVDLLNEGIDLPDANVIAFLRSTASERVFLQQLARGLQKSAIHEQLLVLDYVANEERLELIANLLHDISSHTPKEAEFGPKAVDYPKDSDAPKLHDRPQGNAQFHLEESIKTLFEATSERIKIKERQNNINKLHHERPDLMNKLGIIRAVRTLGPLVRAPRSTHAQAYPNMLASVSFNKAELNRLKKGARDQWSLGWGANPTFMLDKTRPLHEQIEDIFPLHSDLIVENKPLLEFHHELFRVEMHNMSIDRHVYVEPRDALAAIAQDIILRLPSDEIMIDESEGIKLGASLKNEQSEETFSFITNPMTDDIVLRIKDKDGRAISFKYHDIARSKKASIGSIEKRKVTEREGKIVGYEFDDEEILTNIKKLISLRENLESSGRLSASATGLSVRSTELVDQITRLIKNVNYDREKLRKAQHALNEHCADLKYYFNTDYAGKQKVRRDNGVVIEELTPNSWVIASPKATITLHGFDPYRHKIPEISVKLHEGDSLPYKDFEAILKEIHPRFLYQLISTHNVAEIINVEV